MKAMEENMKANTRRIKEMDLEYTFGKMEGNMWVSGKITKKMGKAR